MRRSRSSFRARANRTGPFSVESLEPRHLLAIIHGVVHEDLGGIGAAHENDPGLSGITVFLDDDNDGVLDAGERRTITQADDPSTPDDEAGRYQFDVPAGRYTVRQHLARPATPADLEADVGSPLYLQTAPLRDNRLVNPLSSPLAQAVNQYYPNRYRFEFSGTIADLDVDRLRRSWQSLTVGDRWHVSFDYQFRPQVEAVFDPVMFANEFQVIDQYSLRFHEATAIDGVAELADVDPVTTRITMMLEQPMVQVTIPLQSGDGWRMVIDAQRLPNVSPNNVPRGGDLVEVMGFRIVEGEGLTERVIMHGNADSLQWSSRRAVRFGHLAELLPDGEARFDFWNTRDDDGDGLPNAWEQPGGGLDINGDGVIDLDLSGRGADPRHKDVFVEVDAMAGRAPRADLTGHLDLGGVSATGTVLDRVVAAFAAAPVSNPDGTSGIRLHLDLDETNLPLQPFTRRDQPWFEFDQIQSQHAGGADQRIDDPNRQSILNARRHVYRYAIFADTRSNGSSGLAELPGNNFFVSLGQWPFTRPDGTTVAGGSPDQQVGTFMHELGHTLGLRHGGHDDLNFKPNYVSVMNYHWQVPNANIGWALDYSSEQLPDIDPSHLHEPRGIGSLNDDRRHVLVGHDALRHVPLSGPVDWNRDGDRLDTDVQAPLYRGYFADSDGRSRTYDVEPTDDARFDTALHGNHDWNLMPEDFSFRDDPEFADGVHVCDNPDQEQAVCVEDLTDFLTLSVSQDVFEPDSIDLPIVIPPLEGNDLFDFDPDTGISTGFFSLHNLDDHDSFRLPDTGSTAGQVRANLTFVPTGSRDPELVVTDGQGRLVGTQTTRNGRIDVQVDLESSNLAGDLHFTIKPQGVDIGAKPTPPTIDPQNAYRYRLEVYAPRIASHDGSRWFGTTATNGQPGDGVDWSQAANWEVNGAADVDANPQTHHTFMETEDNRVIGLAGDRTVRSLQFQDSYTLCETACSDVLTITDGTIDILPQHVATIGAEMRAGQSQLIKRGQGVLATSAVLSTLSVFDGTLRGAPIVEGDLRIGPKARFEPDGNSMVRDHWILDGTTVIDVADDSAGVTAGAIRFGPSSVLVVNATSSLAKANTSVSRTILQGSVELTASTDQPTIALVRGADQSVSLISRHAGFGVFVRDTHYLAESVELDLFQASAGDTNGDGAFNSTDLIEALRSGKYERDADATWLQGDWDGNGRFDSSDLILALQQGTYAQAVMPRNVGYDWRAAKIQFHAIVASALQQVHWERSSRVERTTDFAIRKPYT